MPGKTTKVFVYRNLRTGTWSVRNSKRIVVSHPTEIWIENATFLVSEKIRQSVIAKRRKQVHAGVKGQRLLDFTICDGMVEVTYNPYLYSSFVRKDNLMPVSFAPLVLMTKEMKVFALNPI